MHRLTTIEAFKLILRDEFYKEIAGETLTQSQLYLRFETAMSEATVRTLREGK